MKWRGSDLHETGSRMYGTSRCSLSSSTVLSGATCAVQFLAYLVVQFAASLVLGTYRERASMKPTACTVHFAAYLVVQFLAYLAMKLVRSSVVRTCLASGSQSV